jgi:glycosyltransferase involved in cell wall biosynthesis
MTGPLVSVVLPTKNRARMVRDAIQSVLSQSYAPLELIVVDDGSTDDTREMLAALKDERIRVHTLPESQGASGARNVGIEAVRGEWIAFQDSDDLWMPDKLRKQIDCALAHPDCVAVYTSYWRTDGAVREVLPRPGPGLDGEVLPRLSRGNVITTQALMVRADVARSMGGFDPDLLALDDWDFVLRVAQLGPVQWISEPLVEYRLQPDSITASQDKFVRSYQQIMEKHRAIILPDARAEAWHWATIGNRLCREGNACRGRDFLGRAWRCYPFDPRYAGAWLISWFPTASFRIFTKAYARFRS